MSSNEFLERLRKVLNEVREGGLDLLVDWPAHGNATLDAVAKIKTAFPELRDAGQEANDSIVRLKEARADLLAACVEYRDHGPSALVDELVEYALRKAEGGDDGV